LDYSPSFEWAIARANEYIFDIVAVFGLRLANEPNIETCLAPWELELKFLPPEHVQLGPQFFAVEASVV
jgi:hypothetical protein